jgi:MFS family permease
LSQGEILPSTETRKPKYFYGYVIVVTTFLILLMFGGATFTYGVFFKPMATEFGWTRAVTSGPYALYMIMQGVLSVVTGRLCDRFGPRIIITVTGLFMGLGLLLMATTSAVWHIYVFYGLLLSTGMSGFIPIMSTVTRWFVKKRGLMNGISVSGVGAGIMILPPLASWLIASYGWRISYILMGILVGVVSMGASQFLKRDPGKMHLLPYGHDEVQAGGVSLDSEGLSTEEAIHTRQFWLTFVAFFGFGGFMQAIMVHIVPHTSDLGISATTAATILTIIGGLGIPGRMILGVASDRIKKRTVLIISFAMTTVTLAWLLVANQMWMFYLFAIGFGLFHGGIVVIQAPLVADLFGLRAHGTNLGIVGLAYSIGAAAITVLSGYLFDITGSYIPAFIIMSSVSFISLLASSFLTPVRRRQRKEES